MMGSIHDHKNNYIFEKAKHYCAYQERCIADVRKKLVDWNVRPESIGKIIHLLLSEDYINEERFVRIFAGGKFRIKKWGRNKIYAALRARGIADNLIRLGLEEIDEEEYAQTLNALINKKKESLKDPASPDGRNKVIHYALSRGFERHLVFRYL
ncbi:MAG: regulatory protein RecX [Bacteroidales bacterium]|nr:regulatory protein RecX [Bacteroidales bacterium]